MEIATHEVRGTLIWHDHGVSPYWALRSISHALGGGKTFETTIADETDYRMIELDQIAWWRFADATERHAAETLIK